MLLQKEPFPAGTTLKLVETMKADQGRCRGTGNHATEGSHGFIASSASAPGDGRGGRGIRNRSAHREPARTEARSEDSAAGGDQARYSGDQAGSRAGRSAREQGQLAAEADDTRGVDPPANTPTGTEGQPATTPTTTPAATPAQPEATPPAVVDQKPTPVPPAKPAERSMGSLETLEASFQRVRAEPMMEAEFDALIAEFERTMSDGQDEVSAAVQPAGGQAGVPAAAGRLARSGPRDRGSQAAGQRCPEPVDAAAGGAGGEAYTVDVGQVPSNVYDSSLR